MNTNTDAETLAIIIGGNKQAAQAKAAAIIERVRSTRFLGILNESDFFDLGLTPSQSARVLATINLARRMNTPEFQDRPKVSAAKDAYNLLRDKLEHLPHEEFYCLILNVAGEVTHTVCHSKGGTAGTVVDIKIVFADALKRRAASIILAHNHPSGNLQPSQADIELTRKMKKAGEVLDLQVLDHLIISHRGFYSFAEEGML